MTPLRVLLIGMAGNVHLQRWAAGLRERGAVVSVLSTSPLPQPLPPALQSLALLSIPTATAGMQPAQRAATLLRGWARVPGIVAALRPDVVHLHALPVPAAVPFLGLVPRLIVSAWGSDVVQRDARKALWYPLLLERAAAVTATSRYLAGVVDGYLRRPRAVEVVPFGVDVARFRPAAEPAALPRVGTLRHLEALYGIDVLLDALPPLVAALPELKVIVGGAGSLRQALLDQARHLGVDRHVSWPGRVPHEQVPDLLRSLQVFAVPSRAESFGVAALEAQACGVPVVASAVGGLPEVVRGGATGLLVPPDDPAALGAALLELLGDQSQRAAMGAAGRHWVAESFDWQRSLDAMLALYSRSAGA